MCVFRTYFSALENFVNRVLNFLESNPGYFLVNESQYEQPLLVKELFLFPFLYERMLNLAERNKK